MSTRLKIKGALLAAFVILSDNMRVMGNFQKRFQEGD